MKKNISSVIIPKIKLVQGVLHDCNVMEWFNKIGLKSLTNNNLVEYIILSEPRSFVLTIEMHGSLASFQLVEQEPFS